MDRDRLYKKFWYKSNTNESMREALQGIVSKATDVAYVAEGDTVLDIGANDGTLLRLVQRNHQEQWASTLALS